MLITTSRLYLREFVADDWLALLRYQSDARYLRYYPWDTRTAADVQALLQRFLLWQHEQPRARYQLAIVLRCDGQLIGNCGLRKPYAAAVAAELGCELAPDYWGEGYAAEAVRALLNAGFRELHLEQVWASCIAENSAAIRLVERVGMHYEGRLPEQCWMKDRWWDTVLYELFADAWQ